MLRRVGALSVSGEAAPSRKIGDGWPALKRARRRLLMPLFCLPDTGLFGLTRLEKHIVICGFPRSGTTMLQMMLENALPQARRFGREVGAWRAATFAWRNHPLLISKVPHDLFRLEALRDFYSHRSAKLQIILMLRDPRDVLTSQRTTGGPRGYVVSCERWRRYYSAFRNHRRDPDVLEVRYEDLVSSIDCTQARVEAFLDLEMAVPFRHFHEIDRPDFDTSTLNGLRPIEQTLLERWAGDCHRERIEQALTEIPELPEALVELGYASDESWISQWQEASKAEDPVAA
jgi:hypothetical protein